MAGKAKTHNNRDNEDSNARMSGSSGHPGARATTASKTTADSGVSASTDSAPRRERSMGGSQGTREEMRDASPRTGSPPDSDADASAGREGGYGSDSGYSDGDRGSRDAGAADRNEDRKADSTHGATESLSSSSRNGKPRSR